MLFSLNPSPLLPPQKQILLLTSPRAPQFADPLNMQFVLKEVFVLGWWWWLLQELGTPACYCKAAQENGSAGQTALVAEWLLRGPWWLQAEKVQLVPRHLGCVRTLLTHSVIWIFQMDVKNKKTGHHLALLISTCIPLTKGKNDAGNL